MNKAIVIGCSFLWLCVIAEAVLLILSPTVLVALCLAVTVAAAAVPSYMAVRL